jgi:hypothetical protein
MTFDISDTLAPKSDQLDAVDLLGKPPRIFTITGVRKGSSDEQPVEVRLAEFPRVWRPGKSMRRVLAACWSADAKTWIGKRVELFCDEEVVFGGEKVGGIRISRLSDIPAPKSVPILIKKGRSAGYKVGVLPPTGRQGDAVAARPDSIARQAPTTDGGRAERGDPRTPSGVAHSDLQQAEEQHTYEPLAGGAA